MFTETRADQHSGLYPEGRQAPHSKRLPVHSSRHWSSHKQTDGRSLQVTNLTFMKVPSEYGVKEALSHLYVVELQI